MSRIGTARVAGLMVATALVAGCNGGGFDPDLRGRVAGGLDTSEAARAAIADRPDPDGSGLITYPTYQVAVARRGDTVANVAQRVGIGAEELAEFNGLQPGSRLNANAVLALPRRVTPGQAARPDITQIAGAAIDRASTPGGPATPVAVQTGQEPVRHQVARGETAFSIARLYGVSPASLAEWNGLGSDFAIREGQYLLIPLVVGEGGEPGLASPGGGSATPIPPSASSALPQTVEEETLPESPNFDQFRTEASAEPEPEPEPVPVAQTQPAAGVGPSSLRRPVQGDVLRPFSARNEGVDFRAAEGTPVTAAAAGTVAAITRDTDQVPILVLRHEGGLLTVYANIKDIQVEKGDSISAGQRLASVGGGDPAFLHFEVRRGFDAVDPEPLLR
ncbi:M23 family metallopeptidase [Jannaschia formosa]|uniref:M23 family metallopeptidase n=1 Tax=Jannaschia formosa TaxID=2259592 RepID=UPI000E1B7A93|nr:M23 family metallopeptidase [Jannaschia formosa]TFL16810.1 LysM peptidoglycan-binding domain-containing protein [Jannaschia formosa]